MPRFAWDRNFFKACKSGETYKFAGIGWGWIYFGPILFQLKRKEENA